MDVPDPNDQEVQDAQKKLGAFRANKVLTKDAPERHQGNRSPALDLAANLDHPHAAFSLPRPFTPA
jgi:hypothetical protein